MRRVAAAALVLVVSFGAPAAMVSPAGASGPRYVLPVAGASYGRSHHDYPAADLFPAAGCGATVMAPTAGTVSQIRRVDRWQASTDNPALRGGKTIALKGTDGVRYYFAHLSAIGSNIVVGTKVVPGQPIGKVGRTGRAAVCHLHFALSIPCPRLEWEVRRGVIWPQSYLDAWRIHEDLSPAIQLTHWARNHSSACETAEAAPHASEA